MKQFDRYGILRLTGFAILLCTLVGLAFSAGVLYERKTAIKTFPLLAQAYNLLTNNAIQDLPSDTILEYGMVRGLMQTMNDPYTTFVEPPETVISTNQLQGRYGGIGARLERDSQGIIRLYPFPDSPAEKNRILKGDRLVKIDQLIIEPTTPMVNIDAALSGMVDQLISLTVIHPGESSPQTLTFARQEFLLPTVTWNIVPEHPAIGIFQVNLIAATTPDEIEKAVKNLRQQGATSLIMDLRNNGGGYVESGVAIARLFLRDGEVLHEKYRTKSEKIYTVESIGPLLDIPLVILVNQNTASAAEIVAGSLQARGRARLVGCPTFGKGSIQLIYVLMDKSSLHITAAKWWVPGGKPFDGKGLLPDINIPQNESQGSRPVDEAVKLLNP